MIKYETVKPLNSNNPENIMVRLDGKWVGTIVPVEVGYTYFPRGSKTSGNIYSTVEEVKKIN